MAIDLPKKIGRDKFEAILIKNSGHIEQFDRILTEEHLMSMASPSMSNVTMEKKEGSNIEFHEFLAHLWLEYLYKIQHHDSTFNPYNFNERVTQFAPLIYYEHKMDTTMA